MRRVLILIPLLALAGCKKEEVPPQRAVKVTVEISGFVPGCVRVTGRDLARGEEVFTDVTDKTRLDDGTPLIVAVFAQDDWGPSAEVEVKAFEGKRTCSDTPVVTQTATVTLVDNDSVDAPAIQLSASDTDGDGYVSDTTGGTDCLDGDAAINPGANELCNSVDDNCNGIQDQDELQLGQPCTEGNSCPGTRQCGANATVVCGDIPTANMAYPDSDGDRHGAMVDAMRFCGPVPTTHVTGPADDCDDTRANVYTGAPERCDTLDNDCDRATDEIFSDLGMTCTESVTQCGGERRCSADGSGTACFATQMQIPWYRDNDGDEHGTGTEVVRSCPKPPGLANVADDCNDGNPFTYPGADELCDELDNDCNGQPEDIAIHCPGGTRTWDDRIVPAADQVWHSASAWTAGGVWAVGNNNRRAVLTPNATDFVVHNSTTGCGNTDSAWYAVWADPQDNGRAYLGSAGGRLAHQATGVANCTQATTTGGLSVYGLVGIRNNNTLELYGVSTTTTVREGGAFFWNGATTVTYNDANNNLAYTTDIHGRSQDTLFAMGGYDGSQGTSTEPQIYRFRPTNPVNNRWAPQLPSGTQGNQLKAIWVVNDKVAFAGGNAGTAFRWDGSTWSPLPFPNTSDFLTSIVAFGASSAYATTHDGTTGRVYRYNGTGWQQIHQAAGVRFNDITGTSPEDLWVVGTGGHIYHWPRWPQ